MSLILCIETGTEVCSVALSRCGEVLACRESHDARSHAQHLAIFVRDMLSELGLTSSDLSAVAVSMGPGSYTGLRIGSSLAKGMCYALNIPLIAVSTLSSMAMGLLDGCEKGAIDLTLAENSVLMPMLDARRMEVYTQAFDLKAKALTDIKAEVITSDSFAEYHAQELILFGSGAAKCVDNLGVTSVTLIPFTLTAKHMSKLAYDKFIAKDFSDIAYFEPLYLKDFVGTSRKGSLLERVMRR